MKKRNKEKDRKKLDELKKLGLFGDKGESEKPEDLDDMLGGAQNTTAVCTQWPTTS